jgi:hypothetical protein
MKTIAHLRRSRFSRGQSLAETALFLPILILLLAGVVEVSSLLNTQNRITTASRIGTGFGATNFDRHNWSATADSMGRVALNTVTDTMVMSPDRWDIWSIYAQTNDSGTAFSAFTATHVYGENAIVAAAEWSAMEPAVSEEMLQQLQSTGLDSAKDIEVVATASYHGAETLLGLPVWRWAGFETIRGLTVMRVDEPAPLSGCPLLPIAIRLNQYSLYPTNWPPGLQLNESPPGSGNYLYPDDNVPLFPPPWDFETPHPNPAPIYEPPVYVNIATAPQLLSDTFSRNWPGIPLNNARPGYLYKAREGTSNGGFGWLSWNGDTSQKGLEASVTFPGNFLTAYPGSRSDIHPNWGGGPGTTRGDGVLEVNEWVEVATGEMAVFRNHFINRYIRTGQPFIMLYYKDVRGTGSNADVQIGGYVISRLHGLQISGPKDDRFMIFEFLGWADECSDFR